MSETIGDVLDRLDKMSPQERAEEILNSTAAAAKKTRERGHEWAADLIELTGEKLGSDNKREALVASVAGAMAAALARDTPEDSPIWQAIRQAGRSMSSIMMLDIIMEHAGDS